eukprot:1158713-Pelagomonas_calceolata.AAC.5
MSIWGGWESCSQELCRGSVERPGRGVSGGGCIVLGLVLSLVLSQLPTGSFTLRFFDTPLDTRVLAAGGTRAMRFHISANALKRALSVGRRSSNMLISSAASLTLSSTCDGDNDGAKFGAPSVGAAGPPSCWSAPPPH